MNQHLKCETNQTNAKYKNLIISSSTSVCQLTKIDLAVAVRLKRKDTSVRWKLKHKKWQEKQKTEEKQYNMKERRRKTRVDGVTDVKSWKVSTVFKWSHILNTVIYAAQEFLWLMIRLFCSRQSDFTCCLIFSCPSVTSQWPHHSLVVDRFTSSALRIQVYIKNLPFFAPVSSALMTNCWQSW